LGSKKTRNMWKAGIALVTVKLFATLRDHAGERELRLEAKNVGEVLNQLISKYGPDFQRQIDKAAVLVNGRNITHLKGKQTRLKEGDVVSLFPPLGGG